MFDISLLNSIVYQALSKEIESLKNRVKILEQESIGNKVIGPGMNNYGRDSMFKRQPKKELNSLIENFQKEKNLKWTELVYNSDERNERRKYI